MIILREKLGKIIDKSAFTGAVLIMLIIIASVPAFRNAVYDANDLKFHMGRIQAVSEALMSGQFPVRYEQNAWYGHGYVSSLFYGNIFLYLPAIIYSVGVPIYRAYNVYIILVNIATVFIGYYSFKNILNDRLYGIIAIVFYTLSGYRLTNIYIRAAVGEYTAMIFIPLCMYGLFRIYKQNKQYSGVSLILPLVLGMTGLIESHVISTELVVMFALLIALINFKKTLLVIKPLVLSGVWTAGLNAFFIVPFLSSYLTLDMTVNKSSEPGNIGCLGLNFRQLFGLVTYDSGIGSPHHPSFNVGLLVLMCNAIVVIYIVAATMKRRKLEKYMVVMCMISVLTFWMSSQYFPWAFIGKIKLIGSLFLTIQFASRFMSIHIPVVIITTMQILKKVSFSELKKFIVLITVCTIALIMTAIFDYTLSFGVNITNTNAAEDWADKLYLPVGTDWEALSNTEVAVVGDEVVLPVLAYKNVTVFDGDGQIIPSKVSKNNCISISSQNSLEDIVIKFVEPVYWRVSEAITILVIILIALLYYVQLRRCKGI